MKRLISGVLILLSFIGFIAEPVFCETLFWINPHGGSKYHLDPNCPSINPRYLPLTVSLTEEELRQPPNDQYRPCSVCVDEEYSFFPEEERETGEPTGEPGRDTIIDPRFSEYALTDYYIDETPVMIGEHDMLAKARSTPEGYSGETRYLLWYRDGTLYRKVDCRYGDPEYWLYEGVFLSLPGGFCGIAAIGTQSLDFYRWEVEGIVPEKCISGNWNNIYGIPEGICAIRKDAQNASAHLFDSTGHEIWSYMFPDASDTWYAKPVAADGNGTYLVDVEADVSLYSMICVRDGQGAWHQNLRGRGTGFYTEDQTFFLTEAASGNNQYSDLILDHRTFDGKSLGKKRLSGDHVVMSIRSVRYDPQTGGYILFGTAVANSRNVYTVFRMELDQQMNQQSVTVRSFSFHNDYAFGVLTTDSDDAFIFSRPYDESYVQPVLVPFEVLPETERHGLRIH